MQAGIGAVIELLVGIVTEVDGGGLTVTLGVGMPIVQRALDTHLLQALLLKQDIHPYHLRAIHLTVVAEDNEVGLLVDTGIFHRLNDPAQPLVHNVQRCLHLLAECAIGMPGRIQIAVMDHQKVRLCVADQAASAAHNKIVKHSGTAKALATGGGEQVGIFPDSLQSHLVSAL